MTQSFYNPVHVVFADDYSPLVELINNRRAVLITSDGMVRRGEAKKLIDASHNIIQTTVAGIKSNPTLAHVEEIAQKVYAHSPQVLLALGGGSVIDCAKGVAALAHQKQGLAWLKKYVVSREPYPKDFLPLPIIALPTTAGTGAEVTMWGALRSDTGKKFSISHPRLYPESALIIPSLTTTLSCDDTLYPALDAFSHAMEAIWNKKSGVISDGFATMALGELKSGFDRLAAGTLDLTTRGHFSRGSLLAGVAMSQTQTAIAHSISYPFTGKFGVPHGLACSFTLPAIFSFLQKNNFSRLDLISAAFKLTQKETSEWLAKTYTKLELARRVADYVGLASLEEIKTELIDGQRSANFIMAINSDQAFELIESGLRP